MRCPSCSPDNGWIQGDRLMTCPCCGKPYGAFCVAPHPYLNNVMEVHPLTYTTYGIGDYKP